MKAQVLQSGLIMKENLWKEIRSMVVEFTQVPVKLSWLSTKVQALFLGDALSAEALLLNLPQLLPSAKSLYWLLMAQGKEFMHLATHRVLKDGLET